MQIVIDIDEEIYNHMKERFMYGYADTELGKVGFAVRNGIPLPKGHGDLVDRGMQDDVIIRLNKDVIIRLNKDDWQITMGEYKKFDRILFEFPVVIPADKDGD